VVLSLAYPWLYQADPTPPVALFSRIMFVVIGLLNAVVGVAASRRAPYERVGLLLTLTAVSWSAYGLIRSANPVLVTVALLAADVWQLFAAHAALAFPDGRVRGGFARAFLMLAYAFTVVAKAWSLAFEDPRPCTGGCPVLPDGWRDPALAAAGESATDVVGTALAIVLVALLAHRYRHATAAMRRVLAPLLAAGAIFALFFVADRFDVAVLPPNLVPATVSLAIGWSLLRDVADRGRSAGLASAAASGSDALADALRTTLRDPSLRVWRRQGDMWVDDQGQSGGPPTAGDGVAVTELARGEAVLGAISHDVVLGHHPTLMGPVRALTGLVLERESLTVSLERQLESTQNAQRRLVTAQDDARRRIERDLHDGVQQVLLGVVLTLQRAQDHPGNRDAALRRQLDAARSQAQQALADLRTLARGVHPAVLSEGGLSGALHALGQRAGYPVEIAAVPVQPAAPETELTAYFVVAEALANTARHADARAAWVDVSCQDDQIVVTVRDDGLGGAQIAPGGGLRNIADRVGAVGGTIAVVSPSGQGTTILVRLPARPPGDPCEPS
jgi:signal transduction histidine kinase